MKTDKARRPLKEANRITLMLDQVLGKDRFDRRPVNVRELALEYSQQTSPDEPIERIESNYLEGCMGALVCGESVPRKWGILYHEDQTQGRINFTIAHEFGHYILHRDLIDDNGLYCDENSVLRRNGEGIEKEADQFAANLLMPLNDFRAQLPAKARPDFDMLGQLAERYDVSLTAAILRWLEYTETRAIMVVSNEGFAHWAKASNAAFRTGRYIKTKGVVFELPEAAAAVRCEFTEEEKFGVRKGAGVWFDEPVIEMCMRSNRYDQEITLLHLEKSDCNSEEEATEQDMYERFTSFKA